MQDRRPPQVDPALVDHAWEQMRAQLDAVMPVEQPRRRLAAWWWLLFLGLLTGVGLLTWLWARDPAQDKLPSLPTPPVAEQSQQQPNSTTQTEIKTPTASTTLSELEGSLVGETRSAEESVDPIEQPSVSHTPGEVWVGASSSDQPPVALLPDVEPVQIEQPALSTDQSAAAAVRVETVRVIAALPSADLPLLAEASTMPGAGAPDVQRPRASRFFLEGTAGLALDESGQLMGLGAGYEWLLGKKWGLSLTGQ
ncbi:MAG: hypothetical protein KDC54_09355, partial [Lewinella sp.]|nr:hypothetical protein [Lewinella sp.]